MADLVWRPAGRPRYDGPLVLDTHIWVWMLDGSMGRCTPKLPPLLDRAAQLGRLFVSEMSFWEVAQKEAAGRLVLTMPIEAWVERAAHVSGIRYLAVDRQTLVTSTRLTEMAGDPADRIIVAAAKLHSAPLVTVDRAIIRYAKANRATSVCDARR